MPGEAEEQEIVSSSEEPEVQSVAENSFESVEVDEDEFVSVHSSAESELAEPEEEPPPLSPVAARRYPLRERKKPDRLIEKIGQLLVDDVVDRSRMVREWLLDS